MIYYWLMLAGLCNKPAVRIYVLVTFGNYSDGGQLKKNTGHNKVQFLHLVCCRNWVWCLNDNESMQQNQLLIS